MALQASPVHLKPSGDICRHANLPELPPQDFTHALHELGRSDGPSEKNLRRPYAHALHREIRAYR
jgi:hypothetical protein